MSEPTIADMFMALGFDGYHDDKVRAALDELGKARALLRETREAFEVTEHAWMEACRERNETQDKLAALLQKSAEQAATIRVLLRLLVEDAK